MGWTTGVRFPAMDWILPPHHRVQNGSGAQPASYPMGTRVSFPGSKVAVMWSLQISLISAEINNA